MATIATVRRSASAAPDLFREQDFDAHARQTNRIKQNILVGIAHVVLAEQPWLL
jgi:hypothetical protein